MILQNGETIYMSFTTAGYLSDAPKAWVTQAVVLDAENRVVKETEHGRVRVLSDVEGIHATAEEAWARCSAELAAFASAVRVAADQCLAKAARATITCEGAAP